MKTRIGLVVLLILTLSMRGAVGIGDTYQQVIAQKGQPGGKMEAGDTMLLRYPDETIRLKAGKVVGVEAAKNRGPAPAPAKVANPTPTPPPERIETPVTKPERTAPAGKVTWTTNYEAAMTAAKEENRRVFAFFTGSDWCGWCMRLQKEILTTSEFTRYAGENLILLELDFPKGKAQSSEVKTQNATLARKFQVSGFPTVIVLDSNGRKVGQLGYQAGGPTPFVKNLKSL
jgi:thiol-disulfide isomerase/thioredoxin